jgi:D-beta-D-heptose 7-phosphate kinase/D-beta-D-heptose 1-phosphate adenosyltransferase
MKRIFVNGTFDIVHRGHLELLEYAYNLGTVLVAIDTDRRVQELKGTSRPINNQNDRAYLLRSLKFTSGVVIFDTDQELIDTIKSYQPDIMIKGSDYRNKPIIGAEYCREIKFYDVVNGYSTTKTIQDIINR